MRTVDYFSDEELVRLYADTQQSRYFEQLYTRYRGKVYQKCFSFTKDPVDAKDLVHDIFLKLSAKLSGFRGDARFSTWLYAITSNHCITQLRSRQFRQEMFIDVDWYQLEIMSEDGQAEVAEQEARQMEQSLYQLTAIEQQMLKMKYQDQISVREIARLNGLTECSVKMRLKRSRDKVRTLYEAL